MKLERMTVTGADDMTNVKGMIELSKEYRFLEWGILFPLSGGSRFPTSEWFAHLLEEKGKTPMNLSAHLCGGDLDDALENKSKINLDEFKRIQLNFHGLNYYQLVMKSVTDTEMTLFTVEKFLESVSNPWKEFFTPFSAPGSMNSLFTDLILADFWPDFWR